MAASNIIRCNLKHNIYDLKRDNKRVSKHTKRFQNKTNIALKIKYVVIPTKDSNNNVIGNISESQIQSNHSYLNDVFQDKHDTSLLPNSVQYPHSSAKGNPQIAFIPANASDLTEIAGYIIRLNNVGNRELTSVAECKQEFTNQGHTIEAGVIYVYITNLVVEGYTLLGVSEDIPGAAISILYSTVGSPSNKGSLTGYDEGKTLVHEMGHCFGLYHPHGIDGASTCSEPYVDYIHAKYPEGPKQLLPTYYSDIYSLPNGKDNVNRDFHRLCNGDASYNNPGSTSLTNLYSCVPDICSNQEQPYELFTNFMQYSEDNSLFMFTGTNVNDMRNTIANNPNLFDSTGSIETNNKSFPVWAIVVISIASVILVSVISYFLYKRFHSKKKHEGNSKKHKKKHHKS